MNVKTMYLTETPVLNTKFPLAFQEYQLILHLFEEKKTVLKKPLHVAEISSMNGR